MKNVGHIAAKNVLIFALALDRLLPRRVRDRLRRRRQRPRRRLRLRPVGRRAAVDRRRRRSRWFSEIPARRGYLFEVVFCGVSLAIVWGAMAERTKLWVYFAFGVVFTLIYSVVSHWIWSPDGWLFAKGMQDFAGSTVVHYQGALAALAGRSCSGRASASSAVTESRTRSPATTWRTRRSASIILWFGWFGFNPGSTLGVDIGDRIGFFAYVALNTNLAAAAGVARRVSSRRGRDQEARPVDDAERRDRRARRDHGRVVRFVAPWAAIVIGFVAGLIAVVGVLARRADRHRRPDRRGRGARHVRRLGDARRSASSRCRRSRRTSRPARGGLVYGGGFHQLGVQAARPRRRRVRSPSPPRSASSGSMKRHVGIRIEPEVETAGLDVSEHGMWGYPEFYIPVPGGYGTEAHGHLGLAHHRARGARACAVAVAGHPAAEPVTHWSFRAMTRVLDSGHGRGVLAPSPSRDRRRVDEPNDFGPDTARAMSLLLDWGHGSTGLAGGPSSGAALCRALRGLRRHPPELRRGFARQSLEQGGRPLRAGEAHCCSSSVRSSSRGAARGDHELARSGARPRPSGSRT